MTTTTSYYRDCAHCGRQVYETTVLSTGKRQWVHRHTGSAYCYERQVDSPMGKPKDVLAAKEKSS